MKLKTAAKILFLVMVLMHSFPRVYFAKADSSIQEMQLIAEFLYHAGADDSRETALALALYGAKHKAVLMSAGHLADRGLLKDYGDKKMEIFCLVVDGQQSSILDEWFSEKDRTQRVKITSHLSLTDFVKAEIKNEALEKEETHFSWQEEMDPVVSPAIAPALELSRAFRFIRRHHWRMAIIYLDHLEKKYPHWGPLFLAKAMAYLGMHETEKAVSALSSACYLGDQEACLKINELDPSD
jgi:hypothetical protein